MQLDLEQEHRLYLQKVAARRKFLIIAAASALPITLAIYFFFYYQPTISEQEYFDSAIQHYQKGEIGAATIELKNTLKANPENTKARFLLGKIYLTLELGAPAEKELKRSLGKTSDSRKLNQMLAEAQLLQGKAKEALKTIQSNTEDSEQLSYDDNFLMGQAYFKLQEWANAEESYRRALEQTDSIDPLIGLGEVAFAKGDVAIAAQYVAQAEDLASKSWKMWSLKGDIARSRNEQDDASAAYSEATQLKPNAIEPRLFHAIIAITKGEFEDATQDAQALLRYNANHPAGNYIQGQIHFAQEQFKLAQTSFELALRFSNYPPVIRQLGITHFKLNNIGQAETLLEDYLDIAPQDIEVKKLLSAIYIQQGKFDNAKKVLTSVASTITLNEPQQRLMAELEHATGESDNAINMLSAIIDKNPNSLGARLQLGQTLLLEGKPRQALEILVEAVEQDPSSSNAKLLTIKSHLQLMDYESALALTEQLKLQDPENPLVASLDGIIYLAAGDHENAKTHFLASFKKNPGDILSGQQLALMAMGNKDYQQARNYYSKILKKNSHHLKTEIQLGLLESEAGNPELAQQLLTQTITDHPQPPQPKLALAHIHLLRDEPLKAILQLLKIKKLMGQSPEYLGVLGRAYMQSEQYVLAVDTITQLNKVQPSAESYWLEARARFKQKDLKRARIALENAQQRAPNTAKFDDAMLELLVTETQAAIQRKNYYIANQNLTEIKKHKKPLPYFILRARLEESQGNYVASAKYYQQAQAVKPLTKTIASQIRVLGLSGLIIQAEKIANDWLQQYPDDHQLIFELANSQLIANRNTEAMINYQKLLSVVPDDIVVLNNLAFLYINSDLPKAANYAKRAYKNAPNNAAVIDTYGWILFQQGQYEQALLLLKKAHGLDASIASIRYHLASALAEHGDTTGAIELLKPLSQQTFEEKPEANALLYTLESAPK